MDLTSQQPADHDESQRNPAAQQQALAAQPEDLLGGGATLRQEEFLSEGGQGAPACARVPAHTILELVARLEACFVEESTKTNQAIMDTLSALKQRAACAIKQQEVKSYESARIEREREAEAQRSAAIEHARLLEVDANNAQKVKQAEESKKELRVQKKTQKLEQLSSSSFEHAREQIDKESAEWQRQQLAKSEQYSHVFRQQWWLKVCEATTMMNDANEAKISLQDVLPGQQQSTDIIDLVLVYSGPSSAENPGDAIFFSENLLFGDASKATPPSYIDETIGDAHITSDYACFTSVQLITDPSTDIFGNFSRCVLDFQRLESFECIPLTLCTFSFFVDHEQESVEAVQCRSAVAMVKILYDGKAFAVVSSSTVWDPGGFPTRCRNTTQYKQ